LTLPAIFGLTHYHFTLEALEPLHLPPFKGSALRGGFGYTFKRLVCFQPTPCRGKCQLGNACPYGYIFETDPPDGAEVLSNLQDVPRPFLIQPPLDRRETFEPGERLTFGLTLIGRGINYLPYFVAVFKELGQVGLGRTRAKYRLLATDGVSPYDNATEPVYRAEDEQVHAGNLTVSSRAIIDHAAALPTDHLTLDFLTPTRLKHAGRLAKNGPPFHVLIRRLLDRVSSLAYFHCGERWEIDFPGWIERAKAVEIAGARTTWQDWERYSGRQKRRIKMGGLAGKVTYQGDLAPYRALLALGSLVHVGKGTVFGNGRFSVSA
jgi:hypothetical protein